MNSTSNRPAWVSWLAPGIVALILASLGFVYLSGYQSLSIRTGSMEPAISAGSLVFLKSQEHYEIGDVIAFEEADGSYLTHRIVGVDGDRFITKGDANSDIDMLDRPLVQADIIGKVADLSVPRIGYLFDGEFWQIKFQQQPYIIWPFFGLILAAAALIWYGTRPQKGDEEVNDDEVSKTPHS